VEPWIPCAVGRTGGENERWSQAAVKWRIGVVRSLVSGEQDENSQQSRCGKREQLTVTCFFIYIVFSLWCK
jgi:hypothetical protein